MVFCAVTVTAVQAEDITNATEIEITKSWTQEPGGWTYPIRVHVPDEMPTGGYPVCVLLHGAGSDGTGLLNGFQQVLPDHILVVPSGYQQGWNICREDSEAPDVEMVRELIEIIQSYENVNANAIRIFGSSNGAALSHRVYIEVDNPGIDTVVTAISQLSDIQYRASNFYRPAGEPDETADFCGYGELVTPLTTRRYLNICNENDPTIPYEGGFSRESEIAYLEARMSAFRIAQAKGYSDGPLLGDGDEIGESNVYKYEYLKGDVVHLRGFAFHAMNQTQEEYVSAFLGTWPDAEEDCFGDFNGDGVVNGGDLGLMVAGWGTAEYDLTGDGVTNGADLGLMLNAWGDCI